MTLKKPLSFQDQVERLRTHGMYFRDDKKAAEILGEINYYRFTGFATEWRKAPHDSDFRDGAVFEDVYRIYQLDSELRNFLWKYLAFAEVYYRTQIAYCFGLANCVTPPHDQHYDDAFFEDKKKYKEVLGSLKKETTYRGDDLFVKHHQEAYGSKMPIWVMVELLSFTNLSKFYKSMRTTDRECIAQSVGTTEQILGNHLYCLSVLRNRCAHHARLYNVEMNPPPKLGKGFLRRFRKYQQTKSLTAYMIVLMKRLPPDQWYRDEFLTDLGNIIYRYDGIDLNGYGFTDILGKDIVDFLKKYR